ncbi:MAG: hypothetical protein J0H18_10015 [Rhizobiales bacterium]|nr:hypothetical protein [Hyphomicrobiales bacterium]OJX98693.1 MAG: hypothetical protein BGP07_13215 [Rhizobiales bacterium 63-22]
MRERSVPKAPLLWTKIVKAGAEEAYPAAPGMGGCGKISAAVILNAAEQLIKKDLRRTDG